jgi:hypothetical protein
MRIYKKTSDTYSDIDVVIRKDESSIRCRKLGVRHCTNLADAMWMFIQGQRI